MTRIFITGSTGFVGRSLCEYLLDQKHEVIGLVHDIRHVDGVSTYHYIILGDVRDYALMRRVMSEYKPDVVIHLAAQAIVKTANENPQETFDINVKGTYTILSAILDSRIKPWFLHFSTDKVYGEGLNKKETDPLKATGYYETSKAAGDMVAQAFSKALPVCITRACNIYGPGDRNDRIIPNVIRTCLRGQAPEIFANDTLREYVYIDDVVRAVDYLMRKGQCGVWNLGTDGTPRTNSHVVQLIADQFHLNPFYEERRDRTVELKEQSLNCAKFDAMREFEATSFTEGIKRTCDWWKHES